MAVGLHGKALVPALIEMPLAFGVRMGPPTLGVRDGEPSHEFRQFAVLFGPNDQMPVIGHQTPGENINGGSLPRQLENSFVCFIISPLVKEGRTKIAPVENMVNKSANILSSASWHGAKVAAS